MINGEKGKEGSKNAILILQWPLEIKVANSSFETLLLTLTHISFQFTRSSLGRGVLSLLPKFQDPRTV